MSDFQYQIVKYIGGIVAALYRSYSDLAGAKLLVGLLTEEGDRCEFIVKNVQLTAPDGRFWSFWNSKSDNRDRCPTRETCLSTVIPSDMSF